LGGHRIVEIGAVELVDHSPTVRTFNRYVCPQRAMPAGAIAVHGLTAEFLADKPLFGDVADELLAFVGDAPQPVNRLSTRCRTLRLERALSSLTGLIDQLL
jgi:DNA polymerase-3 subunit epsilon